MSDVEKLVAAFKALRNDMGLTPEKLSDYEGGWLLDLLLTPGDPDAGLGVLAALIEAIPSEESASIVGDFSRHRSKRAVAKAVGVALAIGTDDDGKDFASHGTLVARRDWACGVKPYAPRGECFFPGGIPRTHNRWEDDNGFPALARLILHRRAVAEKDAFQAQAHRNLNSAGHVEPFSPVVATIPEREPDTASPLPTNATPSGSRFNRMKSWINSRRGDYFDRFDMVADHLTRGERLFFFATLIGLPFLGGAAAAFAFIEMLHSIHLTK
ncbi:hypothetical protein [Streptomyces sp. PTY087I2]|uniref:hypothetical protein n=1 Tax=Streptomyces sp. PTY087I2 TaxID=1819298 RepID=UPI000827A876|nr:hypothetical protein [Streptomyces sp. PTY087I2]OCC09541.1 hypothetical protein A3Q37_04583 [Streptomyces sp. PTY087I2]